MSFILLLNVRNHKGPVFHSASMFFFKSLGKTASEVVMTK